MREFARRKSEPAADLSDSRVEDKSELRPTSLMRFFHGWLGEPTPVEEKRFDEADTGIRRISKAESGAITRLTLRQAEPPKPSRSILTVRERLGLARATVRESENHRTWPADVILKFQAAEVVTRREQK